MRGRLSGMTALRLTKDELKETIVTLYGMLCDGKSEEEIRDEMGVTAEDLEALREAMLNAKGDELRRKPTEHVYVEYMIAQSKNIRDLDYMVKDFKATRQYNALVGAVRAKSEILDKIVNKGQEFGIIEKRAERREVVAGVLVANLSNKELQNSIMGEIKELNRLMKGANVNVLDLEVPPTHYKTVEEPKALEAPEAEAAPSPAPAKAPSSKKPAGKPATAAAR